jgi:UDP-3-O-[3-hydroxymyristoyl] glucosamine N-acyltransferase
MTANEIANLLGGTTTLEMTLTRVGAAGEATADCVVFAEDEKSLAAALASGAGLVLAKRSDEDARVLRVDDPRYAFAQCAQALAVKAEADVHPSAVVDASVTMGERVRIGARAVVEAEVTLGDDVSIASGATVLRGVEIGNRVVVQAGAVLGAIGFGYVRHAKTGEYLLFPQQGKLVIEDDVEIGSNTTIDRGALGETRIGRGTKIDNLVHIGHNCRIGKNVVIAAQVGISGSCVVEDGAVLAGQVGISDHCHIGPGVILGGQAGVFRGKSVDGPGEVFAGTPAEPIKEYLKSMARVRRLK